MKNFLLIFLSVFLVVGASAQYTITDDDGVYTITNGGTVYVDLPNATDISVLHFTLHSTNGMDIIFQTVSADQPDGAENGACVGEHCYSGNYYGEEQEPLSAGNIAHLKLDYNPNGNTETATVNYKISQVWNPSNNFTFSIQYTISTNVENLAKGLELNAYPNPANEKVSISYNAVDEAELVIYNIVGEKVIRRELSVGVNNIEVETSALPSGTYFYSIVSGAKSTKTKRLVIKH